MSQATLMSREEYVAFLNLLLEAERAGAHTLADWIDEPAAGADIRAPLLAAQRDEARNCASLIELLMAAGAKPSMATGGFHRRARSLCTWAERLSFLNRGQAWVERRIAEALPRLEDQTAKQVLAAMRESHRANIDVCDRLLRSVASARERAAVSLHPMPHKEMQ